MAESCFEKGKGMDYISAGIEIPWLTL